MVSWLAYCNGLIITVCRIMWNHHFSKGHVAGLVELCGVIKPLDVALVLHCCISFQQVVFVDPSTSAGADGKICSIFFLCVD